MATYFLNSDAGSNTAPFDTWESAATSMESLYQHVTLSNHDQLFVGTTHKENFTTGQYLNFGGAILISSDVLEGDETDFAAGKKGTQFNSDNEVIITLFGEGSLSLLVGVNVETLGRICVDNVSVTRGRMSSGGDICLLGGSEIHPPLDAEKYESAQLNYTHQEKANDDDKRV